MRTYRALQLLRPGAVDNFKMVDLPLRPPHADELLIKTKACAIAYRDILDRQGAFKFIRQPTVLGHEFSGIVDSVGHNLKSCGLKEGDPIVSLHWDQSKAWPSPLKQAGAVNTMFGLTCDGGYAEYVYCSPGSVAPAPRGISLTHASCVVSTFGTCWSGAVTKGALREKEHVLVTGASGGVGMSMVKIAKAIGCTVTGTTTSPSKERFLRETLSCDEVIVSPDSKFKPQRQAHLVLEAVGGPTFSSSLRALTPGGRIILIGNVENSVCSLPLGYCILNSIQIIGSDSIERSDYINNFCPFMEEHRLLPEIHEVMAFEDIPRAHQLL
jgi:NADPH:quinone reductase-like Zn-dependent oxidoreductase